jgi:hypothetical protein
MRQRTSTQLWGKQGARAALIAGVVTGACCLPASALAAPASAALAGAVSPTPAKGTPTLADTGTTEQVRQLVQCGGTMYAVGTFTQIKQGSSTVTRHNAFSFSATAPYAVTSWNPNVNGTVDSIAFNGSNCSHAYLGGHFTTVGGVAAKNIAEVNSAGALVTAFKSNASGEVDTLVVANGHLLAGGAFKGINGSTADPYFASLSPSTGGDDGFAHLSISGHYVYPGVKTNPTKTYNQQLSHGGTRDLVEGDFTKVGGLPRQQIFMLDLSGTKATVTGWSSPEWDGSKGNLPGGYAYQCSVKEAFYLRAAAWSPDNSTVYTAATGFNPWNVSTSSPRTGLCDSVAAFSSASGEQTHKWINYTGCDSLYSVAADSSAVYIGGHERWANNTNGCNHPGTGSLPAPGLGGFQLNGTLIKNASGTAGLYSRSRGLGADDLLVTSAGLWIASDNSGGNTSCGGKSGYAGICFLPYA